MISTRINSKISPQSLENTQGLQKCEIGANQTRIELQTSSLTKEPLTVLYVVIGFGSGPLLTQLQLKQVKLGQIL